MTGWAEYEAEVEVSGIDGPLAGAADSASAHLDPRFGAFLEYKYFLTDDFALGGWAGVRSFDPDRISLFGVGFDGAPFETFHLALTSRYFLSPMGHSERWKPFLGLDLSYVPRVPLEAEVTYAPGVQERVEYSGDSYFTLNPVVGTSYCLADRLTLDLGTFYEFALGSSDDVITLNTPMGTAHVDGSLDPSGFIFFAVLTYSF